MDKIVIGGHEFTREDILSGEIFISNSIPCDELAADALNATLDGSEEQYTVFAPSDADGLLTVDDELFTVLPRFRVLAHDLSAFGYGEPVLYYRGDTLVGKFYLVRPQRVGKHTFDISCTSAIGLLDRLQHYGGIYNGTPAGDVMADVIGGAIEYTVAPAVAAIPVYGWLPVGTRRDNLRQILFATGASVKKSAIGEVNVTFLDSGGQTNISDDRMSLSGSVDYKTTATAVAVTEHSYVQFATDETVTLYDGPVTSASITTPAGAEATGMLVKFADPAHTLSIVGGTIMESGVNYAVIAGGNVTLTGKKYTHATNVIMRQAKNLPLGAQENLVKVEEATLVSAANSGNVAERVLAFYSASRVVRARIVYGDERPGDAVAFNDPFGDDAAGLIQSQSISISNTLMADTEIAVGYAPTGGGNNFTNAVVLTGNGEFTIPDGVENIRAVVIGGGDAGFDGEAGAAGSLGTSTLGNTRATAKLSRGQKVSTIATGTLTAGAAGVGGRGGIAGNPGKVLSVDLAVAPGAKFAYACGPAGEANGAPGSNSVFGELSSSDGSYYERGYYDPLTGAVYAARGANGINGGDGGGPGEDGAPTPGADGGKKLTGGNVTGNQEDSESGGGERYVRVKGAVSAQLGHAGGGAAGGGSGTVAGGTGRDAQAPASLYNIYLEYRSVIAYAFGLSGGDGGNGADGPSATGLGSSGSGGGGGGGVGANGAVNNTTEATLTQWYSNNEIYEFTVRAQSLARTVGTRTPGRGGIGSAGAPGCVIIYY